MSIKFLIVDEYLQEIRKCFCVILRKMVTIAKSSLCEERKTKKIGEISAVSTKTLKRSLQFKKKTDIIN